MIRNADITGIYKFEYSSPRTNAYNFCKGKYETLPPQLIKDRVIISKDPRDMYNAVSKKQPFESCYTHNVYDYSTSSLFSDGEYIIDGFNEYVRHSGTLITFIPGKPHAISPPWKVRMFLLASEETVYGRSYVPQGSYADCAYGDGRYNRIIEDVVEYILYMETDTSTMVRISREYDSPDMYCDSEWRDPIGIDRINDISSRLLSLQKQR